MKKLILSLVLGAGLAAQAGVVSVDRVTSFSADDAIWAASVDKSTGPGWTLGTRPYGHIQGGWEYNPTFKLPMQLGLEVIKVTPDISIDMPITFRYYNK